MSGTLKFIRKSQLILSSIYVLGCGFRSIIPRGDVRRIVLVDSWVSSIAIGRSVATIAELSFVAQWAFLLYEIGKSTGNRYCLVVSKIIVPIIIVAECFSWYACTTTNFIGTTIEESLWAIAAALTLVGFLQARPLYEGIQRNFLTAGVACSILYVIYMVTVDVPAYVNKWLVDQAAGKHYATVKDGLIEVATQFRVTHLYADWQYEMVWMTLYFSVAVWISMLIVNAPLMDKTAIRNR